MRDFFLRLVAAAALGAALACGIHIWRVMHPPPDPPTLTEPVRRLASAGEYFLIQYVASRTPTGVIGFPPGTRVMKREERGELWLMNDGRYDLEVRPAQLTNDLDVAALAEHLDATAQGALAAYQQRELDEWQRARVAQEARQASGANSGEAATRSSVGGRPNPLGDSGSAVAGGRRVAGSAWVYPNLMMVERSGNVGSVTDLRTRVPDPPTVRTSR